MFLQLRATRGLAPRPLMGWTHGHLVMHSLLMGLEHARVLPPLVVLVGPCLPMHVERYAQPDALPLALRPWLVEADAGTCLILVSMVCVGQVGHEEVRGIKQVHNTHAHTFTSLGDELMHLSCVLFVYGLGNRAQLQD